MENKETLEEAAENYRYNWDKFSGGLDTTFTAINFIKGAEWQAERMYSEEEVISMLKLLSYDLHNIYPLNSLEEWFEQFKKTKDGK
jgi:hypothetical protein